MLSTRLAMGDFRDEFTLSLPDGRLWRDIAVPLKRIAGPGFLFVFGQ
jgi:hypothetical protein